MFSINPRKKWTWRSPNGHHHNEIDYILTNRFKYIKKFDVIRNLNFNTDHRMIRCELILNLKLRRRHVKSVGYTRELPIISKDDGGILEHKFMTAVNKYTEIQSQYDSLESELHVILKQLPEERKKINNYINEGTERLLERRKLLYRMKRTKEVKSEITKISKEINRNITQEKKNKRKETFVRLINKSGAIRKAYKELSDKTEWTSKLKNKQGTIQSRRPDIIKEATKFYTMLYKNTKKSDPSSPTHNDMPIIGKMAKNAVPDILKVEIEQAINSQKNDKTPGKDNITNEVLKSMCTSLVTPLQALFNNILRTGKTPNQWSKSTIILLHKKGDRSDLANYRPINLLSNVYKVFSKIILNRITISLEENQPREQAGFRKSYSTIDHIQAVTQVIEKGKEFRKPLYLCFIDYTKAFDSLYFEAIWSSLEQQGIDIQYINIIHSLYSKCQAKVRLEREGTEFPIERGVRQGDPLSPKIFSAVLESVFRRLNWDNRGVLVDGELLNHLRFADDIVVFAETPDDLESMVNELATESRKVGLSMNITKTKILTNSYYKDISIGNEKIEYVKEYIYLGQLVSFENNIESEIKRRITLAWKKFWTLKEIMKNKTIDVSTKKKIYEITILPSLTYGCQTWPVRKEDEDRIAICQRKMERSMLGLKLSDKITNVQLRRITKVMDAQKRIRLLKWHWAGHICRMNNNRWTKRLTEWIPRDRKRGKGRPSKRWRDIFSQRGGSSWMRTARDREVWKGLGEAYADEATTTCT